MAATQGNAKAQATIGIMYHDGQGVPQDYVRSYAWLNIASAQNLEKAQNLRDLVSKKLNKSDLIEAQELSNEYYELFVSPFQ